MKLSRLSTILKTLVELGPAQTALYARYKLGLHLGLLRRATAGNSSDQVLPDERFAIHIPFPMPDRERLAETVSQVGRDAAVREAEEILDGQVRLFGGEPVPLRFDLPERLQHWTAYESGAAEIPADDVKLIWEPARLGWAVKLGRAYRLTADERYARTCLGNIAAFLRANPPYLGPNWISAQEAAIRILGLVFVTAVVDSSPELTEQVRTMLGRAIAAHAHRIPPTLSYARAQNNNHLIVEGLGLYTAGVSLPEHPQAPNWRSNGLKWYLRALNEQIAPNGAYVQHSTNYHRLVLQACLWGGMLNREVGEPIPNAIQTKLAAATTWLLALVEERNGYVPNLGPNDGAYLFPLSWGGFYDYRPVAQAAARAFLGHPAFPAGDWDEMSIWFGYRMDVERSTYAQRAPQIVLRHPELDSRSYIRVARFNSRPGHADQLHMDLWYAGSNLAIDPGTYLYNASPPWDNALMGADVHNTITIDGNDQMTRAGRFLWLDWAQGEMLVHESAPERGVQRAIARHTGYLREGMIHRRSLEAQPSGWLVEDLVVAVESDARSTAHRVRLHWLLPDYPFRLLDDSLDKILHLETPVGPVRLRLGPSNSLNQRSPELEQVSFSLARAGESLNGTGSVPAYRGWCSPTYAHKVPALSIAYTLRGISPLALRSEWVFEG